MKPNTRKLIILAVVVAAVICVVVLKVKSRPEPEPAQSSTRVTNSLPTLIDLGAGKCASCKALKPVMAELEKKFSDKLNVRFIDVWEHPEEAKPFNIEMIPTLIFIDKDGKELFRHIGFMSEEQILKKWQELGVKI